MTPKEAIEELGLEVKCQFVPLSDSRNAIINPRTSRPQAPINASELSLNWKATIGLNDRPFLTVDYMQGIGHAPAYKASVRELGNPNSMMRFEALAYEAEKGRYSPRGNLSIGGKPLPEPGAEDVLYSLVMDASALDYPRFEDWVEEYGYEADSRKAEEMYRACLGIGLSLRAAIGDKGLEMLKEAFQDY